MRSSKLALAVVLGVLVIARTAPPASASQEWLIDHRTLSELELKEEEFAVTSKATTVLSVASLKLTLKCKTTKGSGKIFSGGTDEMSLSLSACEAEKLPACKPAEPVNVTAKSKLASTTNGFHEKFEQLNETTPLATITLGEECPLGEKAKLTGAVAGELPAEITAERTIKVSEAFTKKLNEELKAGELPEYTLLYGSKPALLTGEFTATLSGANAGKTLDAQRSTVLCKSPPAGMSRACPAGESWAANTTIKAETLEGEKVQWSFTENPTVICEALRLEGPIGTGVLQPAKITSVSFGASCTGGCTVSAYNLPWDVSFYITTSQMFVATAGFKFDCGTGKVCKFTTIFLATTTIKGGAPAVFELPEIAFLLDSGDTWCDPLGTMKNAAGGKTRFKFWEPAPLYVASS